MKDPALCIRLMVLGAVCLAFPALAADPESEKQAVTDAGWLKLIREGGASRRPDTATLKDFLSRNLAEGKTTSDEVLSLFGKPVSKGEALITDLDRPTRDGVVSRQYPIYYSDGSNNIMLVLDFDAKSKILLKYGLSETICGFCPHVFAYDGSWRLEGKMLAGRIGSGAHGADTMVLPRLLPDGGEYRVKLSNLAPEVEYLSSAKLAVVPLSENEELDILADGELAVWQPLEEIMLGRMQDRSSMMPPSEADLLVLELCNTGEFEEEMRGIYLHGKPARRQTSLQVQFDDAPPIEVSPVGTKFLRRVAIAIPRNTQRISLNCDSEFWYSRRLWYGVRGKCTPDWLSAAQFQPLRLAFNEEAILEFSALAGISKGKLGYALRLEGYYEFVDPK